MSHPAKNCFPISTFPYLNTICRTNSYLYLMWFNENIAVFIFVNGNERCRRTSSHCHHLLWLIMYPNIMTYIVLWPDFLNYGSVDIFFTNLTRRPVQLPQQSTGKKAYLFILLWWIEMNPIQIILSKILRWQIVYSWLMYYGISKKNIFPALL